MERVRGPVAAVLAGVGVVLLGGVVYLSFVFPKTIQAWSEAGKPLSLGEKLLVSLSRACSAYGVAILPVLVLLVLVLSFRAGPGRGGDA